MEEIPKGEWTKEMNSPTQHIRNEFNLIDEIGRGALYRGREEAENYLTGYAFGFWGAILFVLVMFIIGSLIT